MQTRKGDYTQLHHTIAVLRELKVQYGNNAAAKMAEAFAVSLLRQVLIKEIAVVIVIVIVIALHLSWSLQLSLSLSDLLTNST